MERKNKILLYKITCCYTNGVEFWETLVGLTQKSERVESIIRQSLENPDWSLKSLYGGEQYEVFSLDGVKVNYVHYTVELIEVD